jgi:Zn-dependent protease with chaperone function
VTRPRASGPRFGFTRHGLAVHARVADHHPAATPYQRFNKRVAMALTGGVGTMTCFWLFCCLSLCSLPAVLSAFSAFRGDFPAWMIRASIIALVAWVAQTLIQLVLLPALMVGQQLQNMAADARAAKTFEDVERVIDLLRLDTDGGLRDLYDKLHAELAAEKDGTP